MLAVPQDRLTAAVRALEPGARALLDLSLRRGVSDGDIATLLETDPHDVALRRADAIEQVVARLDLHGASDFMRVRAALADLPAEGWGPTPGAGAPAREADAARRRRRSARDDEPPGSHRLTKESSANGSAAAVEPEAPAPAPPARGPFGWPTGRGKSNISLVPAAIVVVLVIVAVTIGVVLANRGSGSASTTAGRTPEQAAQEQRAAARAAKSRAEKRRAAARKRAAGRPVKLANVATVGTGGGSARLIGKGPHARLRVRLYGLPPAKGGDYEIWLYNSVSNAVPLGSFARRGIDLNARLPANWQRYRYLDVSLEPADGNQNHSGQSLLRAPLARLQSP